MIRKRNATTYRGGWAGLALGVILSLALSLPAMAAEAEKPEATKPSEPSAKKGTVIDGLVRFRGEARVQPFFDKDHENDVDFVSSKAWLGATHYLDDTNYIRILSQYAGIWGGQSAAISAITTSTDGGPNKFDIREAYMHTGSKDIALRLGRQRMYYGDQRLVGHLDWSNTGRSFDAARLMVEDKNKYYVHVWTSIVNETNSSDLMNNSVNNVDNDVSSTLFNGVYTHFVAMPKLLRLEPYFLNRLTRRTNTQSQATQNLMVPGLRITNKDFEKNKAAGDFDYAVEGAYQLGDAGTTNSSFSAYAVAADVGYKISAIRIGGEFALGSGDDSPGDNKVGTFQNLYHTNHAQYGFIDYTSLQNMMAFGANVKFAPKGGAWVRLAYWNVNLQTAKDDWYAVGGNSTPFPVATKNGQTALYHEVDVTSGYKFKLIALEAGYAIAFAGSAIKNADGTPMWGYVQTTSKF